MTEQLLISKINNLPLDFKKEVFDFVDFLQSKQQTKKPKKKKQIIYGYAKDTITIKPDFDEPLEEFKEYM
jgi:hypothetical protein